MKKTQILVFAFIFSMVSLLGFTTAVKATTVPSGSLIKASLASVYYLGADGKRYVFPNEKTYMTWFSNFNNVVTISDSELGAIMIGGNVTYKPGTRLVKITTDPKTYWVDLHGTLRWVTSEDIAIQLFGSDWNKQIDDVPDAFFVNYKMGSDITSASLPTIDSDYTINKDKQLSNEPDPVSQNGTITLTGKADGTNANLDWSISDMSNPSMGWKVVKSTEPNPVYPGNDYHYLDNSETRADVWSNLSPGTYHFRVCEYLGGSCGTYSNDVTVTIEGTQSNETVVLTGVVDGSNINLDWSISGMTNPPLGWKVVKSTEPNPVYPGNDYHYLDNGETRADVWSGLSSGTYHFRVCEYLGGACDTYSNDIAVTMP